MKHFLFLIAFSLSITFNASAHHIVPLGWCSNGTAYFKTVLFNNNLNVEVQYSTNNITWQAGPSFNTPASGTTTKIFSVPQSNQNVLVYARFRYKSISSNTWTSWQGSTLSTNTFYSGCSTLPIKFEYLRLSKIDVNSIYVEFKANETDGEDRFNIQVSTDGINFKTVAIVLPDAIVKDKVYHLKVKVQ